jgi:hypothetical protein
MNWLQTQSHITTGHQSASQSWCQGSQDQISIPVTLLRFYWYGAASLMRGRVCRLQLLLVLASAVILGSDSRGTHGHILLSQIRDSPQPGGPGPRIYIIQEQGGPVIPPGTGFHFRRLLWLAELSMVEVFGPASTRACLLSKVKVKVTLRLAVYRPSVHLGLDTQDQRFFSSEPLR